MPNDPSYARGFREGQEREGEGEKEGGIVRVAIARCEGCAPVGLKSNYHRHVARLNHPLMCGANACMQPVAYVWLSDSEQAEYINGERFFIVRSKKTTTIEVK